MNKKTSLSQSVNLYLTYASKVLVHLIVINMDSEIPNTNVEPPIRSIFLAASDQYGNSNNSDHNARHIYRLSRRKRTPIARPNKFFLSMNTAINDINKVIAMGLIGLLLIQ